MSIYLPVQNTAGCVWVPGGNPQDAQENKTAREGYVPTLDATVLGASRIKSAHRAGKHGLEKSAPFRPQVQATLSGVPPCLSSKDGPGQGGPHVAVTPHPCHPPSPCCVKRESGSTYPHISAWGTHHGRCWRRHDGSGREGVGEGREGVLVRVLVRVLVLVLVLVELGPQVGRRAQGGPAVSTLRGQETRVQFLSQDVLLWKRRRGRG